MKNIPLCKTMCPTCPFRAGSPYASLVPSLTLSAMMESRICHSTGNNAINRRTGIPEHICRGARQIQLRVMHAKGVITAPTDKAWNAKRVDSGMEPTEVKDPPNRRNSGKGQCEQETK